MPWADKRRPASEYINPHKAARIIAAHRGVCHLCGHDRAEQVDHVVPWAEWTHHDLSVHDASNLAPAHGRPCPTCGIACHDDKSKHEATRGRARTYAERKSAGKRPLEPHPGALPS